MQGLSDHIARFRKFTYVKSANLEEDIRRALLDEFPMNPKI